MPNPPVLTPPDQHPDPPPSPHGEAVSEQHASHQANPRQNLSSPTVRAAVIHRSSSRDGKAQVLAKDLHTNEVYYSYDALIQKKAVQGAMCLISHSNARHARRWSDNTQPVQIDAIHEMTQAYLQEHPQLNIHATYVKQTRISSSAIHVFAITDPLFPNSPPTSLHIPETQLSPYLPNPATNATYALQTTHTNEPHPKLQLLNVAHALVDTTEDYIFHARHTLAAVALLPNALLIGSKEKDASNIDRQTLMQQSKTHDLHVMIREHFNNLPLPTTPITVVIVDNTWSSGYWMLKIEEFFRSGTPHPEGGIQIPSADSDSPTLQVGKVIQIFAAPLGIKATTLYHAHPDLRPHTLAYLKRARVDNLPLQLVNADDQPGGELKQIITLTHEPTKNEQQDFFPLPDDAQVAETKANRVHIIHTATQFHFALPPTTTLTDTSLGQWLINHAITPTQRPTDATRLRKWTAIIPTSLEKELTTYVPTDIHYATLQQVQTLPCTLFGTFTPNNLLKLSKALPKGSRAYPLSQTRARLLLDEDHSANLSDVVTALSAQSLQLRNGTHIVRLILDGNTPTWIDPPTTPRTWGSPSQTLLRDLGHITGPLPEDPPEVLRTHLTILGLAEIPAGDLTWGVNKKEQVSLLLPSSYYTQAKRKFFVDESTGRAFAIMPDATGITPHRKLKPPLLHHCPEPLSYTLRKPKPRPRAAEPCTTPKARSTALAPEEDDGRAMTPPVKARPQNDRDIPHSSNGQQEEKGDSSHSPQLPLSPHSLYDPDSTPPPSDSNDEEWTPAQTRKSSKAKKSLLFTPEKDSLINRWKGSQRRSPRPRPSRSGTNRRTTQASPPSSSLDESPTPSTASDQDTGMIDLTTKAAASKRSRSTSQTHTPTRHPKKHITG